MRKILPALAFLALAACAPSPWDKSGVDAATAARDTGECRAIARDAAFQQYSQPPPEPFAGAVGPSPYTGMRAGSSNTWQYTTSEPNRYWLEERFNDSCMRRRGYDRVPTSRQT